MALIAQTALALMAATVGLGTVQPALIPAAQPGMGRTKMLSEQEPAALDPAALRSFVDQFMASNMARFHVPGATVVVASEGKVVLERGYGYANVEDRVPFTPISRFRAKSVSKTFTAAAVMQLVERGQLDLHAPVTSYLPGFRLPGGNDPPISLDQLLTQSSGIGDRAIGTMTRDRSEAADLRGYLQARMPPRIAPPGTVFSYTDHGISLAGLAVEEVSGLPFAEYAQERILGRLGMARSAFDPPLEEASDMAIGYQFMNGSYRPAPVGYFRVAPAVSLVTTGHDMGLFLAAMLGGGSAGQSILSAETIRVMESRHFALQPSGPGVAYGLYEWPQLGQRVLLHGGLGHGFSNLLVLVPERRVGFFVDTNSDDPDLRYALLRAFMDRFYPTRTTEPRPMNDPDLDRFAGAYGDYRYEGRLEALKELFSQGMVTVRADHSISLSWAPGRWVEIGPLVFQDLDDPNQRIAFQVEADGRVSHVFGPRDDGNLKLPWYRTLQAYGAVVVLFVALFLSAAVAWLASGLRWLRRRRGSTASWLGGARAVGGVVGVLNLAFLVGVPLLLLPYAGLNGTQLDFGPPLPLAFLFAIPLLTAALSPLLAGAAVLAWRTSAWGSATRIHYTALAVGALLFPVFLGSWNLFGLVG